MLKTVRKAFQIEDIRKRIFYTFVMLVIVRLGSQLPTPGVDPTFIKEFFAQQTGDAFNFFEAFTGGSFTNFSIFAFEHHTVHHFIHYYAASHNRNSEIRGDAKRRRRRKKEDCRNYTLM